MYCYVPPEWPKRATVGNGKVIHAARLNHQPERNRWKWDSLQKKNVNLGKEPAKDVLVVACSSNATNGRCEVDNTQLITCKSCMKALGMEERQTEDTRYVVREKASGCFYNKNGFGQKQWKENVFNATLYKMRAIANKHTKKGVWVHIETGKVLTTKEFWKVEPSYKKQYIRETISDDRYEVKTIKLVLED